MKTLLEQYRDEIAQWDWEAIVNETYQHIEERYDGLYGYSWLGSVFALTPSGKYYTPWAHSNVTEEEAERDQTWYTALDLVAEHYGLFVTANEGNATDLMAVNYLGELNTEAQEVYCKIARLLREKDERKIRYKTWAMRLGSDLVGIRHHQTIVLTVDRYGQFTLDCDGWRSYTTKQRLNRWLPPGYGVYQENHVWYLYTPDGGKHTYRDGMVIAPVGEVFHARADDRDLVALAQAIKDYARAFAEAAVEGKVIWKNINVCEPCKAFRPTKTPIPRATMQDHLRNHIKEWEFVPSLVFAATRAYPVSKLARYHITNAVLYGVSDGSDWVKEIAQRQLTSSLRRTLYRALELGS